MIIKLGSKNWRDELFGHLDVDAEGGLCYTQGKLANLHTNQKVYFQDAPLNDYNFVFEIDKMIRDGGYTANGKFIKLPAKLEFYRCQTDINSIRNLQAKFKWDIPENQPDFLQNKKTKIINDVSFFYFTQEAALKNGILIKQDIFNDWISSDTAAIRVTTRLSVDQWHTLLEKLEKIGRTDICIIQDDPSLQPTNWNKENTFNVENKVISDNIKIILNDTGLLPSISEKKQTEESLEVQLSPDSYVSRLTSRIKQISLKKRFFDVENTEFLAALENGRLINIYGLEYNDRLMLEFESLLGEPPSLVVDGFYRTFPKAKINFHLPNKTEMPTSLWRDIRNIAEKVYSNSLKQIKNELVKKYSAKKEVDSKLSSEVFDLVAKIAQESNDIPMLDKSPRSKIVLCEYFFDKIWKQAIIEKELDGSKKVTKSHFQKALNSIFAKRYRGEPEQYRYIKFLIDNKFSEKPATIDFIGLSHWVKKQKKITSELIQENFWLLSQYIPYKGIKLRKTKIDKFFDAFTIANIKYFFSLKNLVQGIKFLISASLDLLKHIILLPYYIIQSVCKLVNVCLIYLSKIIPWMDTRIHAQAITSAEKKSSISLKDAAISGSEALDFVYRTILVTMENEKQKAELQESLNISNKELLKHKKKLNQYTDNCYQVETVLRSICYTIDSNTLDNATRNEIKDHGYQALCHKLSIKITKKIIELQSIKDVQEDKKSAIINEINQLLNKILPGDQNIEDRKKIAEDLLLCTKQEKVKSFWKFWMNRRMARCVSRVQAHPFTMIKGYSGSGKSYIAKKVAGMLNKNEPPTIINVKADMSYEDAHGYFKLDNKELKYIKSEFRKWAENKTEGYHTLILDEFTLTSELWDILRTMASKPAYINIDGEKINLTDKHRIIMTSNPDNFTGRKTNESLTSMTAEMFYFPLAEGFLKEQVIEPEVNQFINRINFSDDINIKANAIEKIATCVSDLYTQYTKLIPGYEFTPRDLTDCFSRIETYFTDYITGKNKDEITIEMIYSVVREAMKQSVANSLSNEYSGHLEAINVWSEARFPADNKITDELENKFNVFYTDLEKFLKGHLREDYNKFDLNNIVTKKSFYNKFILHLRNQLEIDTGVIHGGRRGFITTGSPGQAKDVSWSILVEYLQKVRGIDLKFDNYTANFKSTDSIVNQTEKKFEQGGIICVSELNTYDTQSIEGHLNDLLTDRPKAPGFLFVATINNAKTTRGRHELSPALLSRFTQENMEEYNFDDLKNICKQQINNEDYADIITRVHWRVRSAMIKNKKNALPAIADIKKIASKAINDKKILSKKELSSILIENYSKYLQLLGWDNKKITEFFASDIIESEINQADYMQQITIWINQQTNEELNSIVVNKGIITGYSVNTGILTLSKADQEKPIIEQQKIIKHIINETLFGTSKKEKFIIPEVQVESSSVDISKDLSKTETGEPQDNYNDKIDATATNIDTNFKVSSNDSVDPNVLKLLGSNEGLYKYNLLYKYAGKLIEVPLRMVGGFKYIGNIVSDYFKEKLKKASSLVLTSGINKILSREENMTNYLGMSGRMNAIVDLTGSEIEIVPTDNIKILAKKALSELTENQLLKTSKVQDKLKLIRKDEQYILNFFENIDKADKKLEDTVIVGDLFEIFVEIDGPACSTFFCCLLMMQENLYMLSYFTKIISKGYVNCNTVIKLLESRHNLITSTLAARDILYKCCETLKEGKNIENIVAIIKYLINRNVDYFDSKTLYSLLTLSKLYQLEDLASVVKKVLGTRYQNLFTKQIEIPATTYKPTDFNQKRTIPVQAEGALTTVINRNLNKLLSTNIEREIVHTWQPTGSFEASKLLENRPPFRDIRTKKSASKEVVIMGSPVMPSIKLAATFYHAPTNQVVNLYPFIFNEDGSRRVIYDEDEKKLKEYLSSIGIVSTYKDIEFFTEYFTGMFISLQTKCEGEYGYKAHEVCNEALGLMHDFFAEEVNGKLKAKELQDWSCIPSTYISKLASEKLLERTEGITYCLKFSHASEVGSIKVKNKLELQRLDNHINETTRYKLLLSLPTSHNDQELSQVMEFEKAKIKELAKNDKLTVLHQQDIENLITQDRD